MMSVSYKTFMLSVIMLNLVTMSVVALSYLRKMFMKSTKGVLQVFRQQLNRK